MSHKILILGENPPISYLNALKRVGISFDCRFAVSNYRKYGGLLLTGGGDVLPAFYGGGVDAENINFIRDEAELNALSYFTAHGLPVLAICRGAQIVNVFFGGTLKCVENHHKADGEHAFHSVICRNSSPFFISSVNSLHRQAIDVLGKNAEVEIVAEDNVVEAVRFGENTLCLQFHPEKMNDAAIDVFYGEFSEKIRKVSLSPKVLRRALRFLSRLLPFASRRRRNTL